MSGMFGVVSKEQCTETLFYGTDYHTHLGTEFGGMAVLGETFIRRIHAISGSQFKSKFHDCYRHFQGNIGIGAISATDEQPVYLKSRFGDLCIVTDGFIENAEQLAYQLMQDGVSFAEFSAQGINQTELIAKLIIQGETLVDGIERMHECIEGSTSLLILHRDGIYCARDRLGYTALAIGQRGGDFAVTSETSAFVNNDFDLTSHMGPGEVVLLNESGMQQLRAPQQRKQVCSFLWIYTGFPASTIDGRSVEEVRQECGRHLARRDKGLSIDIASGVPDSGIAHALGYAMESKVPYKRPLIKYTPGYGRSYTPPSQNTRDLVARMKLIPAREIINGKRIVICDDSIVRGTQLKNFTVKKLWDNGAKEVHARIACPPLMYPCKFIYSTRSISELAARRTIRQIEGSNIDDVSSYIDDSSEKHAAMIDLMARDMGVSSLKFLSIDDMVQSIGLPREDLCLYCWNGQCPHKG